MIVLSADVIATLKWLAIRSKHGDAGRPVDLMGLRIDAEHSALLRRLLGGLPVLPVPPPRHYSYPWYDLIENGRADVFEAWEPRDLPGSLVIDQGMWEVVDRPSPGQWIVTYSYNEVERGVASRVQHPGRWRVTTGSVKPHMKFTIEVSS